MTGAVRPSSEGTFELERVGFAHPDVTLLVTEVQDFYTARYGGPDETPLDPAMFEPPTGSFYIGRLDGEPVATGAWRRSDVGTYPGLVTVEVKRMYVAPRAQRRGLARRILTHLERSAAEAGARAVVLETGTMQPEAIALYRSSGYEPVPGFGFYKDAPLSRCFGKLL